MSFCPACGTPAVDAADTRFCATCGKELPSRAGTEGSPGAGPAAAAPAGPPPPVPATPPPPPPAAIAPPAAPPPPPGHAPATPGAVPVAVPGAAPWPGAGGVPGSDAPSPVARFTRQVFHGRWDWPALAALAPALLLVALAGVLGATSGGLLSGSGLSFLTRSRLALALVLQGVGAKVTMSTPSDVDDYGGSGDDFGDDSDDGGFGDDFGDDSGDDSGGFGYDGDSGSDSTAGSDSSDGGFGSDGDYGSDDLFGSSSGGAGSDDLFGGGSDPSSVSGAGVDPTMHYGSYRTGGSLHTGAHGYTHGYAHGYAHQYAHDYVAAGGSSSAHYALSMVPLTVTVLWLTALVLALRVVRRRQSGPAAAVRVALLSGAATLVLALCAQPDPAQTSIGTTPVAPTLWALVLALATALVMLPGAGRAAWSAARPQVTASLRVLRTAAVALAATLLIAGAVVFVVALAHYDRTTGWGLVLLAFLLPNIGAAGLGLGWGTPTTMSRGIRTSDGGNSLRDSYGLSDLNHVWGGWATVGAVAGGVLCALLIGLLALRRSRGRGEQFAVAGVFTLLFVVVAALSRVGTRWSLLGDAASDSHLRLGPEAGSILLFGLLWSVGGVLVAPYVAPLLGLLPPAPGVQVPGPYGSPGAPGSPYAPPTRGRSAYGQPPAGPPRPVPPQAGPPGYGPAPTGPAATAPTPATSASTGPAPATPAPDTPDPATPAPTGPAPAVPARTPPPTVPDAPAPPAQDVVHDLGIVQPPRLDKRQPPDPR